MSHFIDYGRKSLGAVGITVYLAYNILVNRDLEYSIGKIKICKLFNRIFN